MKKIVSSFVWAEDKDFNKYEVLFEVLLGIEMLAMLEGIMLEFGNKH